MIKPLLSGKMFRFAAAAVCAVIFLVPAALQAKRVEPQKAEKLAKRFAESKHGQGARDNVRLKHTSKRQGQRPGGGTNRMSPMPQDEQDVYYYVFNINENAGGGFVIVAGDDAVKPVLGYSGNGSYDENNLPPGFAYWMDYLQQQIAWAQEQGLEQSEAMRQEWESYLDGDILPEPDDVVEPLIKTKWNQIAPYNDMAPMDVVRGERSVTGCVATAMAQIMKYYEYPVRGTGQSEAYTYTAGELKIDIPSVDFDDYDDYDWDNMLVSYTGSYNEQERDAVAVLMYHAGVSVKMNYSSSSSGAPSLSVPVALTAYFGYDRSIQYRYREFFDDTAWEEMLKAQLDEGMPVYYSGRDNSYGGHAFILDGYKDGGNLFHFNWGWGGNFDGHFVTTALEFHLESPVEPRDYAFNNNHMVIINIKPDDGGVSSGYEMELSGFTVNKTSVRYNEPFTVSFNTLVNVALLDNFPGGQLNAALVNDEDQIVTTVATNKNIGVLPYGYGYTDFILCENCAVPAAVEIGEYKLRLVTRPSSSVDWKIVTLSTDGINNIDFHVIQPVTSVSLDKTSQMLMPDETFTLTPAILPANATNKNVTWSSSDPSVATVDDNGVVTAVSFGRATITVTAKDYGEKTADCIVIVGIFTVTFVDGEGNELKTEQVGYGNSATAPVNDPAKSGFTFDGWDVAFDNITGDLTVIAQWELSVLAADRIIPGNTGGDVNAVSSVNALTGEFTVGPNPVGRQLGAVNLFWQGKRIQSAALTVFDASGNVVNRVKIRDKKDGKDSNGRRVVGAWDLTDIKGRTVSEGTYLIKGVITVDGKRERVLLMVGVR